jgi:TolB-like protein/Tfp pilus assembly protein PilF
MSDSGKAVFLSYASQDAEAARRLADALRAAGVEVWFDQSELVGGDAWDAKIRKQIGSCALFVPIISAGTQARAEGYFRLEWKLADKRMDLMGKSKAFLLPVCIDDTRDSEADVPDSFLTVQWTRLKGGETSPAFAARVKRLLEGESASVAALPGVPATPVASTATKRAGWLVPAIAAAVAATALFVWSPWDQTAPAQPESKRPAAVAPLSEAKKLVAQARQVYEGGDEINRENLMFAEDLVKRALALDPADPAAWELAARLSHALVWYSLDASAARREQLMQQANRARALAPGSTSAQLATIDARLALNFGRMAVAPGFEQEVRDLITREPGNWNAQRAWSTLLRFIPGRQEESLAAIRRAVELSNGNPGPIADLINTLVRQRKFAEADAVMVRYLPDHPTARLLCWDVILCLRWRGGPAAAQQSLVRFPTWLLQEDRGLFLAWQTWYWSRDAARALRAAQAAQRDYVRDFSYYGPRAALTAQAHELAGNMEAARADWLVALARAERELAEDAQAEDALYWQAWALARLGRVAEARPITAQLRQRNQGGLSAFFKGTSLAALLATTGEIDEALTEISTRLTTLDDSIGVTRPSLELDPAFDPLRDNPRFMALLQQAPAPDRLKLENGGPATARAADDKSVAVLAFANLSSDKEQEYFSDGISEELLNVLAKVPGLKVSARTSAFSFKGKEVPIPEIAKQLGVAYVVEGSVRKAGDKVRITAQLIKAADGFHVWSDTFTRDLKDIFAVQDEIAGLVAKNLQLKMGITAPGQRRMTSPDAYEQYLVGRALATSGSVAAMRDGIARFRRAVELDPEFTAAWAQIARSFVHLSRWGGLLTAAEWEETHRAAARAVELEPTSADALLALGWVRRTADWNWKGAETALREALQLRPDHAETLTSLAVLLANIGREQEAIALAQRAVAFDPLNASVQMDLLVIFYCYGRYAEAVQAGQLAARLAPGSSIVRSWLARSLIELNRLDEAEAEINQENNWFSRMGALARLRAKQGRLDDARSLLREMETQAAKIGGAENSYAYLANVWGIVGDAKRGLDYFEKTRTIRDPSIAWARTSFYAPYLKGDPRWPDILRSIGLADDQLK